MRPNIGFYSSAWQEYLNRDRSGAPRLPFRLLNGLIDTVCLWGEGPIQKVSSSNEENLCFSGNYHWTSTFSAQNLQRTESGFFSQFYGVCSFWSKAPICFKGSKQIDTVWFREAHFCIRWLIQKSYREGWTFSSWSGWLWKAFTQLFKLLELLLVEKVNSA